MRKRIAVLTVMVQTQLSWNKCDLELNPRK
jgi:hypothetical protein